MPPSSSDLRRCPNSLWYTGGCNNFRRTHNIDTDTMANEPLLLQLTQLADSYALRQKRAGAVQSSFKLVNDAHNKASKALRDYAEHDTTVDVAGAQAAFARVRVREEAIDPLAADLRREIKTLAALIAALKESTNALRAEPVDVVRLDKALTVLQTSIEQPVLDAVPELQKELELAQRALGDEFGQKLRAALAAQGAAIGGRPPKFEIGRFELDVNFARRFGVLRYGKDVVAPHIPVTVDATVKAYQAAAKAIEGRTQDGAAWLTQLHEAYQIARRKRNVQSDRINIVDVYLEMVLLRQGRAFASEPSKRTFTDYSRPQFIYDFYEFTGRQRLAYQGQIAKLHSATKSQTDSPAKSMWIVEGDSPYDGHFFADIQFVSE